MIIFCNSWLHLDMLFLNQQCLASNISLFLTCMCICSNCISLFIYFALQLICLLTNILILVLNRVQNLLTHCAFIAAMDNLGDRFCNAAGELSGWIDQIVISGTRWLQTCSPWFDQAWLGDGLGVSLRSILRFHAASLVLKVAFTHLLILFYIITSTFYRNYCSITISIFGAIIGRIGRNDAKFSIGFLVVRNSSLGLFIEVFWILEDLHWTFQHFDQDFKLTVGIM